MLALKNNLQYPKFPSHFKWTMKETSGLERRGSFGCLLQDFTWLPLLINDPKNYICLILTIISCNKGPPYIHHTASVRKFSREQKTCQGHLCAKTDEDVFHIGSDKKWQCDNWQLTIDNWQCDNCNLTMIGKVKLIHCLLFFMFFELLFLSGHMWAFKMESNVSLTEKTRDLIREQWWLVFAQKEPNETNWAGLKKLLDLPPTDLTLITRSVIQ